VEQHFDLPLLLEQRLRLLLHLLQLLQLILYLRW
jgi:hypothetical protein